MCAGSRVGRRLLERSGQKVPHCAADHQRRSCSSKAMSREMLELHTASEACAACCKGRLKFVTMLDLKMGGRISVHRRNAV